MSASKMSKWQEFQLVFHTAKNGQKFCASTCSRIFLVVVFHYHHFFLSRHHHQFQELKVNFNKLLTEMHRNKRTSEWNLCVTISIHFFRLSKLLKCAHVLQLRTHMRSISAQVTQKVFLGKKILWHVYSLTCVYFHFVNILWKLQCKFKWIETIRYWN